MSVQAARSLLDELPNMRENKYLYSPVVVFGYIGYRQGFDIELLLPTWFLTPHEVVVITPLEMAVVSVILTSLTISLFEQSKEGVDRDPDSPRTPFHIASVFLLVLGLFGGFAVLILHFESIYAIYLTDIYSVSIIGLTISIFQLLIVVSGLSSFVVDLLHSLLHYMFRKLML